MKKIIHRILNFLYIEFYIPPVNAYVRWKTNVIRNRAIKNAMALSKMNIKGGVGKKIVVFMDHKGDLISFDRDTFLIYKTRGRFLKSTSWRDVLKDAVAVVQYKK